MLAMGLLASPRPVVAEPGRSSVVVEIDDDAARVLDASATRRLIQLELSEMDLELWQSAAEVKRYSPFFFRVSRDTDRTLSLELWNRGEFLGERRVSLSGDRRLLGRQLAFAAAELAKAVKREYQAAMKRRATEARQRALREARAAPLPIYASLRVAPEIHSALLPQSEGSLIGPRLAVALQFSDGPRLELGLGVGLGLLDTGDDASRFRTGEISLLPSYVLALGPGELASEIGLGARVSAAQFWLEGVDLDRSAPGPAGTRQAWSTRAGGVLQFRTALSSRFRLGVDLEAGALLRPVTLHRTTGDVDPLRGLFLGLGLRGEFTVLGAERRSPSTGL